MKYKNNSLKIALALIFPGFLMVGCGGQNASDINDNMMMATPSVDYVESLDVSKSAHDDSFLDQLAMNYRSYGIYNARTSGYPDIGEIFANKAIAAFSGEMPAAESLEQWNIGDSEISFEINNAYNDMMDAFQNDATIESPKVAAEAQAKFDCWISSAASGQGATALECRDRFFKALSALDCGGDLIEKEITTIKKETNIRTEKKQEQFYPITRDMTITGNAKNAREGIIIVNNIEMPEPKPMVFNQNIYSKKSEQIAPTPIVAAPEPTPIIIQQQPATVITTPEPVAAPVVVNQPITDYVTRAEFIEMMNLLRAELNVINSKLEKIGNSETYEKTTIKVQQIPLEPKQRIMEEIFEVQFDFNKAIVKPEYQDLIKKLVDATQNNKNMKVSVVGYTDTVGSQAYNFALGGKRAESVMDMLVEYGIPRSQIVIVSAGENDNKVPTKNGVENAENRRVRIVKEVRYTEKPATMPVQVQTEEILTNSDEIEIKLDKNI